MVVFLINTKMTFHVNRLTFTESENYNKGLAVLLSYQGLVDT